MWKILRASAAAAIVFAAVTGYSQSINSSDLTGTVTDPTGAVIPGVTVTVKDVNKGVTHTFVTNNAGVYDTGSIVADDYLLTFTKPGFTTLVRGPITLIVGTTTINATLKVGSVAQKVVVTTNVPLLNTSNGAQVTTLTSETMKSLPTTGTPDWQQYIWLQPGTSGTPQNDNTANSPVAGQASTDGNLPYGGVLQDGATTTLPMSSNSNVTTFQSTAEVQINSNSFSAQYGLGNVIYNQITKGGTSQFHGSVYDYLENNAMNAAPYGFGVAKKVPILHFNDFGGTLGGPVLPFRHKVFFFFNYDRTIDHGGAANGFETVPTAAMRAGNFTGMPTLYDPTTQTIVNTGSCTYTGPQYPNGKLTVAAPCVQRKSFASEYGNGNVIPASMISPLAKAIQAFYPQPNTPGQLTSAGYAQNNFFYNVPSSSPLIRWFGRLDYDIASNNRLTISETEGDSPAFANAQGICPINCQSEDVSNNNSQISDVWTFSSKLINEARFGFTDQLNFFVPSVIGEGYPGKLGWNFSKANSFPTISTTHFFTINTGTHAIYKMFVFDPSDVVTLIEGKHVLHFGGEFLANQANSTAWGNINPGSYSYAGDYTSAGGVSTASFDGFSYADFLLGQSSHWSASVTPTYYGRWKSPQFFIQDDYKVLPNLTVNLGLRWEGETGWSEVNGNMTVFDPTVINPANNQPGAMWYAFSHANGRTTLQKPKWNIWLPRLGFSYEPVENTVIRGAFGVFAAGWSEDTYGPGMGSAFGSSGSYDDVTNGICPVIQLDSDGQSPDMTDPGCGVGGFNSTSPQSHYLTAPTTPDARNGQSVTYNQYRTPVPKNYQWNVSVQHQFGQNYSTQIAYVGNHGTDLQFPVDINQVPENKLGPDPKANEPYPLYVAVTGSTNNAISNYNALQAEITKRLSNGLQFTVNYTWSHFLDDQDSSAWGSREGNQYYQDAYNPSANYSNSNFDIRNMFKGVAVYDLPFGRGRAFFNHNRALDAVIGGWQTSYTFVIQGGNPFTVLSGQNTSNSQGGDQYPNLVGDYRLRGSTKSRLKEWYNLKAFAVPAPFTFGDFHRNTISGPGLSELNMTLGKTFDVWPERNVQFQIRGSATNVLNHPSFAQPGNNRIGQGESAQITGVTVGGRLIQIYGQFFF